MIQKISDTNPVIKTDTYSLWMIEGLGPVLVFKREPAIEVCDECGAEVGGEMYYIDVHLGGVIKGCGTTLKHGFSSEEVWDKAFEEVTEKGLTTLVAGVKKDFGGTFSEEDLEVGNDEEG